MADEGWEARRADREQSLRPDDPWEVAAQQHGTRRASNLRRARQIGRRRG